MIRGSEQSERSAQDRPDPWNTDTQGARHRHRATSLQTDQVFNLTRPVTGNVSGGPDNLLSGLRSNKKPFPYILRGNIDKLVHAAQPQGGCHEIQTATNRPIHSSGAIPLVPRLQPGNTMNWRLCRLLSHGSNAYPSTSYVSVWGKFILHLSSTSKLPVASQHREQVLWSTTQDLILDGLRRSFDSTGNRSGDALWTARNLALIWILVKLSRKVSKWAGRFFL